VQCACKPSLSRNSHHENLHVNRKIHKPGISALEVEAIDDISDVFDPGTTKQFSPVPSL